MCYGKNGSECHGGDEHSGVKSARARTGCWEPEGSGACESDLAVCHFLWWHMHGRELMGLSIRQRADSSSHKGGTRERSKVLNTWSEATADAVHQMGEHTRWCDSLPVWSFLTRVFSPNSPDVRWLRALFARVSALPGAGQRAYASHEGRRKHWWAGTSVGMSKLSHLTTHVRSVSLIPHAKEVSCGEWVSCWDSRPSSSSEWAPVWTEAIGGFKQGVTNTTQIRKRISFLRVL